MGRARALMNAALSRSRAQAVELAGIDLHQVGGGRWAAEIGLGHGAIGEGVAADVVMHFLPLPVDVTPVP